MTSPVADTAREVGDVILPESVGVPSGAVYAFFIDYVYGGEFCHYFQSL